MGSLLKEALKCLCGDKQWSYAVFWKIACRNPSLLVWEESYYEPAPCSSFSEFSGIESTELLLKEWEKLLLYNSQLSQHGRPSVDRVSLLINKMMMSNQVHVVGEGIVGRAAFTGSHQWILQENHIVNHSSEVLAELHQQFSAGMQTVAVIPVNPHGVVQLGSCQMIMETKKFVNEVKSLFMHLGGVPGALWSGNYNGKEVSLKTGEPLSLEIPVFTGSGNACSQVGNVMSSTRDSCNDKISATPASGHISQPSHSLMQEDVEDHMLKLQRAPAMTKSCNGLSPLKAVSVMKPNFLSEGRLDTGAIGAEMIFSSLDTWLNQWASHNVRSGLNHGLPVGQSEVTSSIPAFIKQQVPFDIGLREPVTNGLRSLNNINASQLRSNGGTVTNSFNDSVVSILEGCESSNASSNNSKLTSNPCSDSIPCRSEAVNSSSSVEVMGHQFVNCSKIDIVPSSCHANHSCSVGVSPEVPKTSYHTTSNKDAQTELAARKQGIENDLFQVLNIQSDLKDEHNFGREPMLDCLHDCLVSRQKHDKANPSAGNIASPDAHSQGNDLFDMLGFDFRSERLKSLNNLQIYGADATTPNAYISPCTTRLEPDPNFYAANEWMSESGIFSESRPDHLLEAMVSKIYRTDKQNSDDTESCRTTLTMISGSSIPTGSPKHSQASVSNQMRVDSGLPPRLAKSAIVGSSSSKSGSSKGNAGECSQTNTIYGSQISSWVEEGQNMKRGNSIITACSKGPDEIMKSNRKRLRPGESPRPRPKDRQMIQDRVKELREIVPNGAKCSIDALLERTIKHMLFLQSVTKHADKLKQTGESKIISKDGGLLLRDNFEGGATWAFELGSRSMVCPIIVEDLNPPRQMLVEMLCEERGFFLEIADIIRGLGLTILKGVMEARNDKIWARFAVEANRDVTRMEIFLALVRLLEQTMKGIGSTEGINNDKLAMNHPLHPVSIPATGSSNAFH